MFVCLCVCLVVLHERVQLVVFCKVYGVQYQPQCWTTNNRKSQLDLLHFWSLKVTDIPQNALNLNEIHCTNTEQHYTGYSYELTALYSGTDLLCTELISTVQGYWSTLYNTVQQRTGYWSTLYNTEQHLSSIDLQFTMYDFFFLLDMWSVLHYFAKHLFQEFCFCTTRVHQIEFFRNCRKIYLFLYCMF